MLIPAVALALALAAPTPVQPVAPAQPVSTQSAENNCPVTGQPIPAGQGVKVMVKGKEFTVRDKGAADQLKATPEKFLEADGTAKNAPKKEAVPAS